MAPPIDRCEIDPRSDQPAFREEIIERLRIEDRVRISGIGQRVSKQAAQAQAFVRRPADIRDAAAQPVLIVRPLVIRIETAQANRVIESVRTTGAAERFPRCPERPALHAHLSRRRAAPAFRENLDHTRQRARSVKRALWTTHHLDAVDIIHAQVREIEQPREPLIHRNPIQQHLRVLAAQASREDRGQLPRRARLRHREARHFAERIGHAPHLPLLQFLRSHDAHARRRFDFRNRQPRRTDDDVFCHRLLRVQDDAARKKQHQRAPGCRVAHASRVLASSEWKTPKFDRRSYLR